MQLIVCDFCAVLGARAFESIYNRLDFSGTNSIRWVPLHLTQIWSVSGTSHHCFIETKPQPWDLLRVYLAQAS